MLSERVIETRQRAMSFAPRDGHAREADVRRLGLFPRLDQRIDRISNAGRHTRRTPGLRPDPPERQSAEPGRCACSSRLPARTCAAVGTLRRGRRRGRSHRRRDRRQQRIVRAGVFRPFPSRPHWCEPRSWVSPAFARPFDPGRPFAPARGLGGGGRRRAQCRRRGGCGRFARIQPLVVSRTRRGRGSGTSSAANRGARIQRSP